MTVTRNVTPIRFLGHPPPLERDARDALKAEAEAFRHAMRHDAHVRAANQNGHDAGYQDGYLEGAQMGLWTGGVAGALGAWLAIVVWHAVAPWLATL